MNSSSILRFVAGAYVIYLAYSILGAVMRGETEGNTTLLVIASILFIVLGIVIIILGYREMKRAKAEAEEEALKEDSEWGEETKETVEVIETTEEVDTESEE